MKCRQCGKQTPKRAICSCFCSRECAREFREGMEETVTIRVVKVPEVFPELRPRLGGVYAAVKKRGYTSTSYLIEQAGKTVLLRNDEVMEVAT